MYIALSTNGNVLCDSYLGLEQDEPNVKEYL